MPVFTYRERKRWDGMDVQGGGIVKGLGRRREGKKILGEREKGRGRGV